MENYSRVYAKINLDAIHFNMESMHEKISEHTKIIAVIKTDAYGHGAIPIAKEIESYSYLSGFAVATAEEAFILRRNRITKPILILGYTFSEHYEEMVEKEIRPTVFSYETAKAFSDAAKKMHSVAKIHIAIDTGMSRIGYQITGEAVDEIAEIAGLPHLEIEGIFTHFARADEADKTSAYEQIRLYQDMIRQLEKRGIFIPVKHCSNSAGIAEIPEANMNMVRAGIILYGLYPSEEVSRTSISLKPVMELKSKIVHIKTLPRGRCISYGGTYQLKEERTIATVPVGYGDGYPRSLSNKGYVYIHGKKAPILGRVCMDQFMVDVTEIPEANLLDTVTLLGKDEESFLSMEELSRLSGRFPYEFACDIGKRIPRVFYKNNQRIDQKDYFSE